MESERKFWQFRRIAHLEVGQNETRRCRLGEGADEQRNKSGELHVGSVGLRRKSSKLRDRRRVERKVKKKMQVCGRNLCRPGLIVVGVKVAWSEKGKSRVKHLVVAELQVRWQHSTCAAPVLSARKEREERCLRLGGGRSEKVLRRVLNMRATAHRDGGLQGTGSRTPTQEHGWP